MTSLISIPFYLWKNTSRRWFEYPVSPVSKILIPTLLGYLSILVLTLFASVERELREQLNRSSALTVVTTEFVQGAATSTLLARTYEEELIWNERFPGKQAAYVRQALVATEVNGLNLPVLAFTDPAAMGLATHPDTPPGIWLLASQPADWDDHAEVLYGSSVRVRAEVRQAPGWLMNHLMIPDAVIVSIELAEEALKKGFITHSVAHLGDLDELKRYVSESKAYYRAENRQVKILSALGLLEELERIQKIQQMVKTLIVVGCGIILALTLGSIAWLEYRQDAYLLALLRSFGSPPIMLLLHAFLENLALVLLGMLLVWFSWAGIYRWATPQLQSFGMQSREIPALGSSDLLILLAAGVTGVVLAMIPVAAGLRKKPGLILQ
jgi:hypothetical protein